MNGLNKIAYGGDYNPEQWPEETWDEDMRLLKEAHIDILTLNVFSWAQLQPSEEEYDFSRLDRIMEMVRANGFRVCLATSTAAHPAWMARKYPDILRQDGHGMKRRFGGRHNSCPNSPTYRKYAPLLAQKLAQRYGACDHLVLWHISNEFGGMCSCENCERAFREWLRSRYGTLAELNRVWNTAFWGHTFYDWEEIVIPDYRSEVMEDGRTQFQGMTLDYRRFTSESLLECYRLEYDAIHRITPDIPITTNLMGFYKGLNYQMWAQYMDVVAWDNYPSNEASPAESAMSHDMMRGLKGGAPFLLMEQTPSVTNWLPYNALKRPGILRLWSWQAVAHGADAVMFFQMRRSIGACEKLHGAVIDHVGTGQTRVFREVRALGAELERIGGMTLGAEGTARAAVYFDWNNWWAMEDCAGPSTELRCLDEVRNWYWALHGLNIPTDIIGPEDDLEKYRVLIAPVMYMVPPRYDERVRRFVRGGGTFVTTFFSGMADEHDLIMTGGYPGCLRDILGIWVEEEDALPSGTVNHFLYEGVRHPAGLLCDLLHPEGAQVLSVYEEDFYAGMPVLTCNHFGKGRAYYAAARSDESFYSAFAGNVCEEAGVTPLIQPEEGLEATERVNENGRFLFLLNHGVHRLEIPMERDGTELLTGRRIHAGDVISLPPRDVAILHSMGETG